LASSGTVTASCPGMCRSVTVTRGTEWRELELDCVGLVFPLITSLLRGSRNESVSQTRITITNNTRNLATFILLLYVG